MPEIQCKKKYSSSISGIMGWHFYVCIYLFYLLFYFCIVEWISLLLFFILRLRRNHNNTLVIFKYDLFFNTTPKFGFIRKMFLTEVLKTVKTFISINIISYYYQCWQQFLLLNIFVEIWYFQNSFMDGKFKSTAFIWNESLSLVINIMHPFWICIYKYNFMEFFCHSHVH